MSPDYARGHRDGYHEAQAERAEELRAMVAWATLRNSDRKAHLDATGTD